MITNLIFKSFNICLIKIAVAAAAKKKTLLMVVKIINSNMIYSFKARIKTNGLTL